MAMPWTLGSSTSLHGGSACLIHGEELVVAIQEERLARVKRAPLDLDHSSLGAVYCLRAAGIRITDIDMVVQCTVDADPSVDPTILRFQSRFGQSLGDEVGYFGNPRSRSDREGLL